MSKIRLIQILLALYPKQWRQEYGEEFSDLLAARPLRLQTALNVGWSAFVQHWRDGEPWFILGTLCMSLNWLISMVVFCLGIPVDIRRALWGDQALWSGLFSTAILFSVGFWTAIRSHPTGSKPGRAAVKTALLSTSPCLVAALLMLAHAAPSIVVGPNGTGHPFAFVYRADELSPHVSMSSPFLGWLFLWSFLLNLPIAGMIGFIGGIMGRFTWWAARIGRPRAH